MSTGGGENITTTTTTTTSNGINIQNEDIESSFEEEETLTLHERVMKLCRESGLESLAKDSGFIQNNEILALRYKPDQDNGNPTTTTTTTTTTTSTQNNFNNTTNSNSLADYYLMTDLRNGRSNSNSNNNSNTIYDVNNNNNNNNNSSSITQNNSQNVLNSSYNAELPSFDSGFNHLFEQTNIAEDGTKKRKKEDKSKGLSYLSLKVCQKVKSKKDTSYIEVSNEIIAEFIAENVKSGAKESDLKTNTMKRRIYDVLNVFQAMNIISKDKQKISWIGLPNSTTPANSGANLERQKQEIQARIKAKKQNLKDILHQEKVYDTLINRNREMIQKNQSNGTVTNDENDRIHLPFIVVNTKNTTVINCEVESDRSKYFFNFSQPFEIHDDSELIRKLNFIPPPSVKQLHYKKKRKKDDPLNSSIDDF